MSGVGSVQLALLAGILHHLALQYPKQKSLFETIAGFAVIESVGATALFLTHNLALVSLLTFSCCYVLANFETIDSRSEHSSSSRWCTTSTSVIVEFQGDGCSVQVIGHSIRCIMANDHTSKFVKCTMKWVN